jgi:hypothetical protein
MKKSNFREIILAILLIIYLPISMFSQTVQLDGSAFLEGQSDHSGIMIAFERFAPQVLYDTAFSDSSGYFAIQLQQGLYNISYSKEGYLGIELAGMAVYSNITLPDTTLEQEGLTGSISGILTSGTYIITGDISVDQGETLIIEPGTTLRFKPETYFWISGLLIAEGTVTDSILFTKYEEENGWRGIHFGSLADDNSTISYATIEYSDEFGISIGDCNPELSHSVIRYNHNQYWQKYGGGIYLSNTEATLYNLCIYGNEADLGGGLYVYIVANYPGESYRPVIANCLIYENTANDGAGIFFETWIYNGIQTYPLLINSTICKNHSEGAVSGLGENVMPDIINNNIAYNDGYGIKSDLGYIHYCGFNNVSGNSAGNFYNPPEWIGENITVNSNGDSCDAYHNTQLDPIFENLDENDFHLNPGSPCIDAGLNDSVMSSTDYEGNPRILYGANSLTVDIGAYEALPVGIESNHQDKYAEMNFTPNPAKDRIQIILPGVYNSDDCMLAIYNARGEQIELVKTQGHSGMIFIDVWRYPPGLYLAILSKTNATLSRGQFIVNL